MCLEVKNCLRRRCNFVTHHFHASFTFETKKAIAHTLTFNIEVLSKLSLFTPKKLFVANIFIMLSNVFNSEWVSFGAVSEVGISHDRPCSVSFKTSEKKLLKNFQIEQSFPTFVCSFLASMPNINGKHEICNRAIKIGACDMSVCFWRISRPMNGQLAKQTTKWRLANKSICSMCAWKLWWQQLSAHNKCFKEWSRRATASRKLFHFSCCVFGVDAWPFFGQYQFQFDQVVSQSTIGCTKKPVWVTSSAS